MTARVIAICIFCYDFSDAVFNDFFDSVFDAVLDAVSDAFLYAVFLHSLMQAETFRPDCTLTGTYC